MFLTLCIIILVCLTQTSIFDVWDHQFIIHLWYRQTIRWLRLTLLVLPVPIFIWYRQTECVSMFNSFWLLYTESYEQCCPWDFYLLTVMTGEQCGPWDFNLPTVMTDVVIVLLVWYDLMIYLYWTVEIKWFLQYNVFVKQ